MTLSDLEREELERYRRDTARAKIHEKLLIGLVGEYLTCVDPVWMNDRSSRLRGLDFDFGGHSLTILSSEGSLVLGGMSNGGILK